jgi:hypothetical protein
MQTAKAITGLADDRKEFFRTMIHDEVDKWIDELLVVFEEDQQPTLEQISELVTRTRQQFLGTFVQLELISRVEKMIPEQTQVILLGDGEFDGIDLQALVNGWKWDYVFRTGKNIILCWNGEEFTFDAVADHVQPDEYFEIPDALFTKKRYGPVFALTWWRKDCKEPIHLVSNMNCLEEVCRSYAKRFRIETFFSDQKGRGFHINKSCLSDPNRISKLLIAACLAYYWVIYLGASAIRSGQHHIIHRTDRCDLSLFQLGLRLLE